MLVVFFSRLEAKLRYQVRQAKEGVFGSSTASSRMPIKANSEQKGKSPRCNPGRKGFGRKSHDGEVDCTIEVEAPDVCPECGVSLEEKGMEERSVLDTPSQKPQRVLFRLITRKM
ncbi:MAG: hypothetical protein HY912_03085 [Desulfomonile tiedjei]|uniref:Uncharacterized protein n=1 Tax=Desulfomonile tiedjei TaxID=2358 RepID=A0A9D6Z2C1_9BACT|nr:hypothetical protein [Desulfomonile tiedjei]